MWVIEQESWSVGPGQWWLSVQWSGRSRATSSTLSSSLSPSQPPQPEPHTSSTGFCEIAVNLSQQGVHLNPAILCTVCLWSWPRGDQGHCLLGGFASVVSPEPPQEGRGRGRWLMRRAPPLEQGASFRGTGQAEHAVVAFRTCNGVGLRTRTVV